MSNFAFCDYGYRFRVAYEDTHACGTLSSRRAESLIASCFEPLVAKIHALGIREAIGRSAQLLAEQLSPAQLGAYLSGPERLREENVYPDPSCARPVALEVLPAQGAARLLSTLGIGKDLPRWLGEWQRGAVAPTGGPARALWNELRELGFIEERAARGVRRAPAGEITFVGHATVRLSTGNTELLVDPFLLPRDPAFPASYQPLGHDDVCPDVVLITHSHPDHFDLGTLLRFGTDTVIVVPDVPRESILAIDMAYRLRELGFEQVRVLRWFEETTVGDYRIVALPFYGEQPISDGALTTQPRNAGNTYLVESPASRFAFVADAGRDPCGDIRNVAAEACAKYGAIDVLFGGYRSWSLYPVQYPMTSVPFNLLFVPRSSWAVRQTIMNDADALLDTAERWHARHVVPYADGGAPWHWQLELGPRLDQPSNSVNPHFDPRPEAVERAAEARSSAGPDLVPSPTRCVLMRPGESLALGGEDPAVVTANEGHRWPYVDAARSAPETWVEPEAITRKRVMLRLLAIDELRRRGAEITPPQLQAFSDSLRREHDLVDRERMLGWLETAGLSMNEYSEILLEWCSVQQLELLLDEEIAQRLDALLAFASMRTMGAS